VEADRQIVYCHNPAPFYDLRIRDILLDPGFAAFRALYGQLYRVNIQRNDLVIVQQEWLAQEFEKRYRPRCVIVAQPDVETPAVQATSAWTERPQRASFIYPTFPRVFKNIEILGEAALILEKEGASDLEFVVTISGRENRYARHILHRYGHLKALRLVGKQSREDVYALYASATGLVFPSRLETWGMPISEMMGFNKPLILSDLPYAHETASDYKRALFVDTSDPENIIGAARLVAGGGARYNESARTTPSNTIVGWNALWRKLLP
jgi:glycosyltransferase involved in cell wall biosynthesis